jgi:hypothetical protein
MIELERIIKINPLQHLCHQKHHKSKVQNKEKILVPDDVEVPEEIVEIHTRNWRKRDISEFWKSEHLEDMISVVHCGQQKAIIFEQEVWDELVKEFDN